MAKSNVQPIAAPKSAAAGTPNILPRPDFHFPGEIGRTYLDSDPAQFPKPVQAPEGAPNILLILIDDCGFGQYGTFGGGIPSPTMDGLAAEGLRYNCFHTTALCSPTRAALITGRTITPQPSRASPRSPPDTTVTPASSPEAAAPSAKSCARTVT
jgi:hypothetical protein